MKKLFVGNMNFQTTETDLRSLFEPFGSVEEIHIATDRDTGRARGFAFVSMTEDDAAEKAIAALNAKEVNGRALNINEARPKTFGGGGGGRDGSRGGFGGGRGRAPRERREPRW
jgi:RNA recognition motif-containing protein